MDKIRYFKKSISTLLIFIILLLTSNSCNSEFENKTVNSSKNQIKKVDNSGFNVEDNSTIIFSSKSKFIVTIYSTKGNEFEKRFKLSIFKVERKINQLIWESELEEGYLFEKLDILKTKKNALITGSYNLGGAHALSNYFVVNLDKNGNVKPENNLEQDGWIERKGNNLTIKEYNQNLNYQIKKNEIIKSIVTRENMSPPNSIKAYFKVDNGKIIGLNNTLNVKVNEPIALIPIDDYSRSLFINGNINIFNIVDNDFSLGEYNRVKSGNSCQFYEKGKFQIVLCEDCDEPRATFTVIVR